MFNKWAYDRYGNRPTQTGTGGAPTKSVAISASTNRITTSGHTYDSAGNMTAEPGHSYQYDAASRIKTVDSGTSGTYSYDGDGRRAKRVTAGETRYYFYDQAGNPIWEYKVGTGWETFNYFFNGRHVAINNTTELLRWRHLDHLGSLRAKTSPVGSLLCSYWYYPYGELAGTTCSEADRRLFTGKERDSESGLDYFGARYYESLLGRFTSTDPARESALPVNPQSWNRFSYTLNNPARFIDPTGEKPLDSVMLQFFNAFFAADFSSVNIHSGSTAHFVNSVARSQGITFRDQILLSPSGAEAYAQRSIPGIALVGHELAHTQQYKWFDTKLFLSLYVANYLSNRLNGQVHDEAYMNIAFEMLARYFQGKIEIFLERNPDIWEKLQKGVPLSEGDLHKIGNPSRGGAGIRVVDDIWSVVKLASSQRKKDFNDPSRVTVIIGGIEQR